MAAIAGLSGMVVLALAWGATGHVLPHLPFTAHMTAHIMVVAIAAPLLAWAAAGTRLDPERHGPSGLFSPIPASMVELIAVWGWHAPVLHTAARGSAPVYAAEQVTFLLAGLVLWSAVLGGEPPAWPRRRMAGVGALLFTSIHMTLLGALFALTTRVFYGHPRGMPGHALLDVQLGGAVMVLVGGLSYMAGALAVLADVVCRADLPSTQTSARSLNV